MDAIPDEWTPEPDARLRAEEIEETLTRWLGIGRAFNAERRAMAAVTTMHSSDKNDMDDVKPDECPHVALDEEKGITWTAYDTDYDGADDSTHMLLPWDVLDGTTSADDWIQAWVAQSYEKVQRVEQEVRDRREASMKREYERLKAYFEGYEPR